MAQDIDITSSDPWQEITVPVDEGDGVTNTYIFELKWNVRDSSWYLNLFEHDGTIIKHGIRVVLGMYLGRRSRHPLFRKGVLVAVDTTVKGREATLDDLGERVVLRYFSVQDVMVGRDLNGVNQDA
jgi:hypothetical protein